MHVSREFDKMYTDTYIQVWHNDAWLPALVLGVDGGTDEMRSVALSAIYENTNKTYSTIAIEKEWDGEKFDLSQPRLGCLNLQKHTIATYVAYTQVRQWKRGFRLSRVNFRTAMSKAVAGFPGVLNRILRHNRDVWEVFNPTYYAISDALKRLDRGYAISVAFHPKYWVALSPVDSRTIIGYKLWPIGTVEGKQMKIDLAFSHLTQELSPIITHQNMEVVVND